MTHLSYEQRYTIEVLLQSKTSKTEIASILSVDKSVIYREIKRNCDKRSGVYKAFLAQNKYENRLAIKPKRIKATEAVKTQGKRI